MKIALLFTLALLVGPLFAAPVLGPSYAEDLAALELTAQRIESGQAVRSDETQQAFFTFEEQYGSAMSREQTLAFQKIVGRAGGIVRGAVLRVPPSTPFWLLNPSRLHEYQSTPELIKEVDYLGVGAGLAGAGAAAELAQWAATGGFSLAWLDAQGVGEGASGRNGGNFADWSERFTGLTESFEPLTGESEGLLSERYKFLKIAHPYLSELELRRRAHESAVLQMQNGIANRDLFLANLERMGLEADVSENGWLRLADSARDEQHVREEMDFARKQGVDVEWWTAEEISARLGIPAKWGGRLVKGFGNYHPYKYVTGVFEWALKQGLQLYTQTKVLKIDSSVGPDQPVLVYTDRGIIRVRKKVLVFTDSYTDFIPGLKGIIQPYQSRIVTFQGVENKFRGLSLTRFAGDWYMNAPRSTWRLASDGTALTSINLGGGPDTPIADPWQLQDDPKNYETLMRQAYEALPFLKGQPPAAAFEGPFAFTPDGMAVVGELQGPRVVGAVGSQGYGGTQSGLLGWVTAKQITETPARAKALRDKYVPETHFGLARFRHYLCELSLKKTATAVRN